MNTRRSFVAGLIAAGTLARAQSKTVSGTVIGFRVEVLEIEIKADAGGDLAIKVGPDTEVVQVPPGERNLSKAKEARVTEIARGDRVLVSYVRGLAEARRIVWMPAWDIEARNEAERADWQKRGISGIVASKDERGITIERRLPGSVDLTLITVTGATTIRKYAPDSVRFVDAVPATADEISVGDQVKARGDKSEDGKSLAADALVFGTFLSKAGTVTAVDANAGEVRIQEVPSRQPLLIRVTSGTTLKMMPDPQAMFAQMMKAQASAHEQPTRRFDIASIISELPAGKVTDIKVGTMVIVSSTKGAKPGEVTAITLMANADGIIGMAQMHGGTPGENPLDAISRMHGGALGGPGGVNLPAIVP
jgi:hypothetical protein